MSAKSITQTKHLSKHARRNNSAVAFTPPDGVINVTEGDVYYVRRVSALASRSAFCLPDEMEKNKIIFQDMLKNFNFSQYA